MIPDLAAERQRVLGLLNALPGKAGNEIMLDWPCAGQASFVWYDIPHAEILARDDLHHFDGMDFRVIHDEGNTDSPIWKLLAAAPDLARQYLEALGELARVTAERDRLKAAASEAAASMQEQVAFWDKMESQAMNDQSWETAARYDARSRSVRPHIKSLCAALAPAPEDRL